MTYILTTSRFLLMTGHISYIDGFFSSQTKSFLESYLSSLL